MTLEKTDLYPDLFSAGDKIYFDHNATAPLCRKILSSAPELLEAFGNPSSIHQFGRRPKKIIRDARNQFAKFIDCHPLELIFTSGGSESNSLVLKSEFLRAKKAGIKNPHFVVSKIEHPASIKSIEQLKELGLKVSWIEVDRNGQVDFSQYQSLFQEPVHLVSCMLANNETGCILPIKEMCQFAKSQGAKFHTDAVQALGKMEFSLKELDVDYASFAGHKFYAMKGVGALFSKQGNVIENLISGGGQERSRRGGTENTLGIASMGIVAEFFPQQKSYIEYVRTLRDSLEEKLVSRISNLEILGRETNRVCNTSSVFIQGVDGESLLMNLDLAGIAVSTGAACSSGNPEPSPVLIAMGLSHAEAQSSMRVSLGWGSTMAEVDRFIEELEKVVIRLRAIKENGGEL